MKNYITKERIPTSSLDDVETQPVSGPKNRTLSDIIISYVQGQYITVDETYEAYSDELNRRMYEAISQYQPPSPPDPLAPVTANSLEELVNYIGDLRN